MDNLTAIILAGGKGERMRPYDGPKCLVEICGRPLLGYLLDHLALYLDRIAVCVGYRGDEVAKYAQKWAYDHKTSYQHLYVISGSEDTPMTDRVLSAKHLVKDRALICYGDTLANVDIELLEAVNKASQCDLTITTVPFETNFGIVEHNGRGALTINEKPKLPYRINIGFAVATQAALDEMDLGQDFIQYVNSLAPAGISAGTYDHDGYHYTVNTERDRERVEEAMAHV